MQTPIAEQTWLLQLEHHLGQAFARVGADVAGFVRGRPMAVFGLAMFAGVVLAQVLRRPERSDES